MNLLMLVPHLFVLLLALRLHRIRVYAQFTFASNNDNNILNNINNNNTNSNWNDNDGYLMDRERLTDSSERILPSAMQNLTRQLISNTVAVVPGVTAGVPLPNTVTTPNSYCQCVPAGSCGTVGAVNDGSGQLDVRIVNNPTTIINPTPGVSLNCIYGLVSCCFAGNYQCGRRFPSPPGSLPAGLGQAAFGEYPWQAAILTTADVYLGSGALITAQHVLTVAHKIYNISPSTFKVRLGEWDAANTNEPIPAEDIGVLSVFVHPNFNSLNLQNDVAIIRLNRAVSLVDKSTIATICLPTQQFVNQRCYVAGWGKNAFGPVGAFQTIQRSVDVPLVTNLDCQTALQRTRLGPTFLLESASFICAGGEPGKDACTGDGGSPLVCQNNNIWYVVGLVAWGIGCATGGVPGVYTNVITYLPWVQTVLATSI